jgi:glycosyltransferase involved in cell wall biosynthesis
LKSIAINGRFLSQPITGVQRYAHELLRELDKLLALRPVGMARNAGDLPSYESLIVKRVGRLTGQLWEQFELPFYCRGKLLFTPCGGAPLLHNAHVVTIPDAAEFATPHAYSRAYRTWYKGMKTGMGRRAGRVITVSEFSRSEIVRWCRVDPARIAVTPEGSDHLKRVQPDRSILDRLHLEPHSYVLAVSSRNPNKNFRGLTRALQFLSDLPVSFVIAGALNSQVFSDSEAIPSSVIEVGHVSDEQLRALYEDAGCFVFPSFYEGFGLPPLEAMASGCPVIAAAIPALRETCADAALYCDPADPSDIARQIGSVMNDLELRQTLIDRGYARAGELRWAHTALETWKILESAALDS